MFAVLNFIEPASGYFDRRKQKLYLRKSEPKIIRTPCGLPFFVVDVLLDKKGVDWEALRAHLGKCAVRVIAPRDIALPDTIRRYTAKRLIPLMVFNTAVNLLERISAAPQGLCITLTDSAALLTGKALQLLPFAAQVRIVTRYPEKYKSCVHEAMEESGASLIVTDYLDSSSFTDIIICTDNCLPAAVNASCVISYARSPRGCLSVNGNGIYTDERYNSVLPKNIEPLDFAGALLELCGCASLTDSCFAALMYSGAEYSYDEISCLIAKSLLP